MTIAAICAVLGMGRSFQSGGRDSSALVAFTRQGLPAGVLTNLAQDLGMDRSAVARTVGIAERTLNRRLSTQARLSPEESDRVVRFARILALARETLGTAPKASHWLQTPNRVLDGQKPLDLLDTDAGVQEVETVLGRIAYGVYS